MHTTSSRSSWLEGVHVSGGGSRIGEVQRVPGKGCVCGSVVYVLCVCVRGMCVHTVCVCVCM